MNPNVYAYVNKDNWPSDLDHAKAFAMEALTTFKFQKKVPQFRAAVEKATTAARVQYIVINAILSGDGYGVVKM